MSRRDMMYKKKYDKELFVILSEGQDYYTVKEVAEVLGVTPSTVQSYITNEVIEAELINGRRMIHRDSLCKRLSQLGKQCIYGYSFEEVNV
jgi:excisionase family DNA binding protein